jgi:hypothetical protein
MVLYIFFLHSRVVSITAPHFYVNHAFFFSMQDRADDGVPFIDGDWELV